MQLELHFHLTAKLVHCHWQCVARSLIRPPIGTTGCYAKRDLSGLHTAYPSMHALSVDCYNSSPVKDQSR